MQEIYSNSLLYFTCTTVDLCVSKDLYPLPYRVNSQGDVVKCYDGEF